MKRDMEHIIKAKRIVVKVGTSTLTYEGGRLNIRRIEKLTKVLSDLKNQGREIVLVSSGAIGVGMGKAGKNERPTATREKQALAAIGQCELMNFYSGLFERYSHTVAQILITRTVVDDPTLYTNARNTFETLLEWGALPIVNENDTISTEQVERLGFGENDTLAASVAELIGADVLVFLSDIDGLYDCDPRANPDAHIIPEVRGVTDDIRAFAGGAGTSRGTGGMATKLQAAEFANRAGVDVIIANGKNPEVLYDIFDGKQAGTLFRRTAKKQGE